MVSANSVLKQSNLRFILKPKEELQFAKAFMDRAADAVFWVNPDAQFLYVNDAVCGLTGYSPEELLSMTVHDLDPDFSAKLWSDYWKTIKQQGSLTFEFLHWTKDDWIPVEFAVTYLEYYGREYGCIFVRNSTKRKPLEVAIERGNEALECRLQERIVKLREANEQLCREIAKRKQAEVEIRQALEQEKELSELRAHFISIISHEFRTPLNNISFSTSLLKGYSHQWTESEKLEYLHGIETDIEQLNYLLDEALSIGGGGKRKFEPRPLDVAQLCRDIVAKMQICDSSQHAFSFVNRGDCSTACVDKKLLQPILTNLLSNAIKYSPPGSKVDLELYYQDENVIFKIKDRGIGIPVADRQQLFEPFHRGRNVGNISGTGLGLSVVKKFVELHGGQISVASEVGVGTTFTVTLLLNEPLVREETMPFIASVD